MTEFGTVPRGRGGEQNYCNCLGGHAEARCRIGECAAARAFVVEYDSRLV